MNSPPPHVPQPTPLSERPSPEVPPHLEPEPSPIGVTTGTITGELELSVVRKLTYGFEPGRNPWLADEQLPLSLTNESHDELVPDVDPSQKSVPELLVYPPGTDVVVRGHARPPRPVSSMRVGVEVGGLRHVARVYGDRYVDRPGERFVFTPPKAFEALPLRYELAYGGVDRDFEAKVAGSAREQAEPEELRRISAAAEDFLQAVPPVAYPRNPYGKGFVLVAKPEDLVGTELPNIELERDRLAPRRLQPPKPDRWMEMPVPAGFDFMDVGMFPRSAMMGLPPMHEGDLDGVAEVTGGQVPPGFCRGNAIYAEKEELPDLVHPEVVRCAPIGLRSPSLRGDEIVTLRGMDPAHPVLRVYLPCVRPVFRLPARGPDGRERELDSELSQVFIDVDARRLSLIWTARTPWARPLQPGEDQELAARIRMKRIRLDTSRA